MSELSWAVLRHWDEMTCVPSRLQTKLPDLYSPGSNLIFPSLFVFIFDCIGFSTYYNFLCLWPVGKSHFCRFFVRPVKRWALETVTVPVFSWKVAAAACFSCVSGHIRLYATVCDSSFLDNLANRDFCPWNTWFLMLSAGQRHKVWKQFTIQQRETQSRHSSFVVFQQNYSSKCSQEHF